MIPSGTKHVLSVYKDFNSTANFRCRRLSCHSGTTCNSAMPSSGLNRKMSFAINLASLCGNQNISRTLGKTRDMANKHEQNQYSCAHQLLNAPAMLFSHCCTLQSACMPRYKWHAEPEDLVLSNEHNSALREQPQNIPFLTG